VCACGAVTDGGGGGGAPSFCDEWPASLTCQFLSFGGLVLGSITFDHGLTFNHHITYARCVLHSGAEALPLLLVSGRAHGVLAASCAGVCTVEGPAGKTAMLIMEAVFATPCRER
jgi:hypothetical protein